MIMSLRGIHEVELVRRSKQDEAAMSGLDQFGAPVASHEHTVRALGLRDRGFAERLDWIGRWTGIASSWSYRADDMRYLCQGDTTFSVLLLHGDDARRMGIIARGFREVHAGKALMAVCSAARREAKGILFASGVDDVVDLAMDPREAAARLRAHARRLKRRLDKGGHADEAMPETIGDLAGVHLSPSERRLLVALAHRPGRTAEYGVLLHALRRSWDHRTLRSLQVIMHNLRRKLPPHLGIETRRGTGYVLHIA